MTLWNPVNQSPKPPMPSHIPSHTCPHPRSCLKSFCTADSDENSQYFQADSLYNECCPFYDTTAVQLPADWESSCGTQMQWLADNTWGFDKWYDDPDVFVNLKSSKVTGFEKLAFNPDDPSSFSLIIHTHSGTVFFHESSSGFNPLTGKSFVSLYDGLTLGSSTGNDARRKLGAELVKNAAHPHRATLGRKQKSAKDDATPNSAA